MGQAGNYIAYLEPGKGEFKRFAIEDGTYPHNLIIDDAGIVWYAGNRNARIGRLDPATGAIKTFAMPDPQVRDLHTLIFDKAGHIWFTVQGGNHIGRFDPHVLPSIIAGDLVRHGCGNDRPCTASLSFGGLTVRERKQSEYARERLRSGAPGQW